MTVEDWQSSLAPKVGGSWNLHTVLPRDLTFFVTLASMCGVIGGVGQANYAAGNAYLDGLARYRTSIGEAAVSLDLGPMLSEGVLAEDQKLKISLESTGFYNFMKIEELYALLDHYCNPQTYPLACIDDAQVVCGINTPATVRFGGIPEPTWMRQPLFSHIYNLTYDVHGRPINLPNGEIPAATAHSSSFTTTNLRINLASTTSSAEAASIVTEALVSRLSKSLAMIPADIDTHRPLDHFGVDSLMAVELRNWFLTDFSADVPIFEILGNRSCEDVGRLVVEKSALFQRVGEGERNEEEE